MRLFHPGVSHATLGWDACVLLSVFLSIAFQGMICAEVCDVYGASAVDWFFKHGAAVVLRERAS